MLPTLRITWQTTTLSLLERNIVVVPLFLPGENELFIAAKTTALFAEPLGASTQVALRGWIYESCPNE